jgi:ubiquitin-protein ligase
MDPRIRRLEAEARRVAEVFQHHPCIRLVTSEGTPPEKYRFEFGVNGLEPVGEDAFTRADRFEAEIFLTLDFPRRPPFCRMITPVFHPNISPQKICIGDHWSAGQSLAELVVQIGQMIGFQRYNTKSPLNACAAAWVEANLARLPLEQRDLSVGL